MYRIWIKKVVVTSFLLLSLCSALIYIVDPFFNFHGPIKKLSYALDWQYEIYQNPGIAKNFDYDSIIIGSSMTENFKTTQFDELFNTKSIKLPYAGGTARDFYSVLKIAFENRSVDKILWGLDPYSVQGNPHDTKNPHPVYLYNNNKYDDIKYLLNKDVLFNNVMKNIKNTSKDIPSTTFDLYARWHDNYEYGKDIVLEGYHSSEEKLEEKDKGIYIDVAKENIELNIIPLIEENQDTTFYFFIPPYSILFWDSIHKSGELTAYLELEKYLISRLIDYKNVNIYYFQNIKEIVCDLNNYKDYTHYSEYINEYIIESIKEGEYLLTRQNYILELNKMKEIVYSIIND